MGEPATTTLEEMCELIVDCPHFTPEWTEAGYIVIRNQQIRNGRLDLTQRSFTHETDFKRRIKRASHVPATSSSPVKRLWGKSAWYLEA